MRIRSLLACLLLACVSGVRAADVAPPRILAYLPDYRIDTLDPSSLSGLTDLIYFSVAPAKDGTLLTERARPTQLGRMRAFKKQYHLRTEIAVGGWQLSDGFAPTSHTPAVRDKFIAALLRLCAANDIGGVDYDWEGPSNPIEERDYTDLIVATAKAVHAVGRRVTAAIAYDQRLDPRAIKALDEIHLMAYDHNGQHSTFTAMKQDVDFALKSGVPALKLLVGVPFYGRIIMNHSQEITYGDIVRQYHPAPEIDVAGGYYFNGPKTIEQKARYIRDKKLGGVMIWEIGQDVPGASSLLHSLIRGLAP